MKLGLCTLLMFCAFTSFGQLNQEVYIFFDPNSGETCNVHNGERNASVPKYNSIKQQNNEVDFYICGFLFLLEKKQKIDTCTSQEVSKIKFSEVTELQKLVDSINPLYPFKVFKKVYLIEPLNDDSFLRYDVKWKYYIE